MKSLFITTLLIMSGLIFASKDPIGEVVILKGKASILKPNTLEANDLVKGQKILKDSSIVTYKKSFVKIKFFNKSVMNIGPKSKVVLNMEDETQTSVVSFLKGKIRASVKKEKNKDKKFIVKTKNALMGVRGTDFQVTYNQGGERTSLLTYEGRVDIKKFSKDEVKDIHTNLTKEKTEKLKKLLDSDVEVVEKGDFTNVVAVEKKPIKPVKISAAQFVLLKKDESLGTEKIVLNKKEKEVLKAEVKKLKKEFKEKVTKREKQREIKELGLVDSNTGFYVPPANSELTKLIGEIDDNGAYIPPKGAKVDEKIGLVAKMDAPKETKTLIKKITQEINKQVNPELHHIEKAPDSKHYKKYFNY